MSGARRRRRTFAIGRGYYVIVDDGSGYEPIPDDTPEDRFVHPGRAGTGGAMVRTGTMTGAVEVEVLDRQPPPEPEGWDDVEEHRLTALGDTVLVAESEGEAPGFDELEVDPGQHYHVRVHARGRDHGRQYVVGPEVPVEIHLVQLWA